MILNVKCMTIAKFNKSSAVAEMGDRGYNTDIGRKEGVLCPFRGGSWVPV